MQYAYFQEQIAGLHKNSPGVWASLEDFGA